VAKIPDTHSSSTIVIAEIGVNHNGSIDLAKELILRAKEAGADYAKFQTFRAESLASDEAPLALYQETNAAHGTQRQLLQSLELSNDDFLALEDFCSSQGIGFLTTAHDFSSAAFVLDMNLDFVKIPSGDVTNRPFLEMVARSRRPVLLSTGMAEFHEVEAAVAVLAGSGLALENITVLQCTTEYPAPIEHANLRAMVSMGEALGVKIGYSDHTTGFTAALVAVALGATVIEKHLTTDTTLQGPDHSASLEPEEFGEMVKAIREVAASLGDGVKKAQPSEVANRDIVRKSIVAKRFIRQGEIYDEAALAVMRPGLGISPMLWHQALGQIAPRDFDRDEPIEFV